MELECEMNEGFNGISQFLIGQHENVVAIVEPTELIDYLNKKIKNIHF